MSRLSKAAKLVLLTPLFVCPAAHADFVQNNYNVFFPGMASDRYFLDDGISFEDYGIETADNFNNVKVNTNSHDLRVTWYGSVESGDTLDQFAIRFYTANGAVPSQGAFYATQMSPTLNFLQTRNGRDIYEYVAEIGAPNLDSGSDYFLSIYAFGTQTDPGADVNNPFPGGNPEDPDPNAFQWLQATDVLAGEEAFREFPLTSTSWISTTDDSIGRAFSLETIADPNPVPEPGSIALLSVVGIGAYGRRRRRKRRQTEN